MYKTEDYGLFLGLMIMPFGKEKEFIEYEIKNIFDRHKANIKKACVKEAQQLFLYHSPLLWLA